MNKLNIKVKLIKRLSGFKLRKEYTIIHRFIYHDIKRVIIDFDTLNQRMVTETTLFEHFDITENQLDKLEIFQ